MTINIICETAPGFSFHYKKLAQTVIEQSLDSEGFPYEAEVNLTLVDEKRIHEINLETRQIDAPTDVLSFPMIAYEFPADFDGVEDQLDDCVNPDTQEELVHLQREILSVVHRYVKSGGKLLYSTCTIHRAENQENAAWFAEQYPEFDW